MKNEHRTSQKNEHIKKQKFTSVANFINERLCAENSLFVSKSRLRDDVEDNGCLGHRFIVNGRKYIPQTIIYDLLARFHSANVLK